MYNLDAKVPHGVVEPSPPGQEVRVAELLAALPHRHFEHFGKEAP